MKDRRCMFNDCGGAEMRDGMDKRKEIVKTIQEMAGRYSAYEIFTDWIRCLALSIEQSTHLLRDERWRKE